MTMEKSMKFDQDIPEKSLKEQDINSEQELTDEAINTRNLQSISEDVNEGNAKINEAEEIKDLKNKLEDAENKLKRSIADSDNLRKRYDKMIQDSKDYAIETFMKDLLGTMDNLSRALEYKSNNNSENHAQSVIDGVAITQAELKSLFNKYGLQSIEPEIGEKFNYNLHHAISQIVTEDYNPDSIVGVMQVGYKLKDRLLRPAIVTVAKKSD